MAEGDRTPVDVELRFVDAQFLHHREDLTGERLVDLDQIDVVELQSRFLESDLRRRNRTDAHDVRIAAGDAPRDDAAERLLVLRIFCCSNSYYSCPVDDSAGVARGDEAVLRERRPQLRETLHRGLGAH